MRNIRYLMGVAIGHIPVSNRYEAIISALLYLHYKIDTLGGFVLFVISAAVGFLLCYTFEKQAHEIQPLAPVLNSYWMKIHVSANFIGYSAFSLTTMIGVIFILRYNAEIKKPIAL